MKVKKMLEKTIQREMRAQDFSNSVKGRIAAYLLSNDSIRSVVDGLGNAANYMWGRRKQIVAGTAGTAAVLAAGCSDDGGYTNQAPVAVLSVPTRGAAPFAADLDGSGSYDPDGSIDEAMFDALSITE